MASSICKDETRWQNLSELAQIGWWEADFSTRHYFLSEYIRKLLGISNNLISFSDFQQYIAESHRGNIRLLSDDGESELKSQTFPIHAAKGIVWVKFLIGNQRIQLDSNLRLYGTLQCIDMPQSSEPKVDWHESETKSDLITNLFEYIPTGIELYDKDAILIDINRRDMDIFGIADKADVLGVDLNDNPNIPQWFREELYTTGKAEAWLDYSFDIINSYFLTHNKNVIKIYCRMSKVYDEQGDFLGYVSINSDNRELKKAQVRINEFEAISSIIAEYAKLGYAKFNLCNMEGFSIEQWNKNMGEPADFLPKQIENMCSQVHPEDREEVMRFIQLAQKGIEDKFTKEIRILLPDTNKCKWMRVVLVVSSYKPEQGVVELLGINYDITKFKETEFGLIVAKERAEESERLKTSFLASMSHEIRTPLNSIVGFSNLLVDEEDLKLRKNYVEIIESNNNLLLQLISDILDLSRMEANAYEFVLAEMNVNQLCDSVVESAKLKVPEGVEVIFDSHQQECVIVSDYNRLNQVLSNLMNNAVKFTSQGSIRLGYTFMAPDRLRFYVKDTGIGIPQDKLGNIFDRFVKLSNFVQGTGLGLSICKHIVEHLGGVVGVESKLGQGSCFWFELPV